LHIISHNHGYYIDGSRSILIKKLNNLKREWKLQLETNIGIGSVI